MSFRNCFGLEFPYSEGEIYLDSATSGKVPVSSINKMHDYYMNLGGGINRGTHRKSLNANRVLEQSRTEIADIFSVESSELAFLPSRETAITNILLSGYFEKEDELIVSTLDDHSILAPALKCRDMKNLNLKFVSLEDETNLTESLQNKITKETKAVMLSSLTLGMGVKRDWEKICQITNENNITFILDISNEVGHEEFSFKGLKPDIVISSGNIGALGPQGTAFQLISREIIGDLDPVLIGGGSVVSLERDRYKLTSNIMKFEPGSMNIGGISALANSLTSLSDIGFKKISEHENSLRKMLIEGLSRINKIDVINRQNLVYGPILSFKSEAIDSHDIAIILEDLGNIFLRSGALCSHLFMEEIKSDSLVQVSTHLYNTQEDIRMFLETLDSIMSEM